VAQEETAEILRQRKDPRRPVPAITFRDTYTVKLGGQTLVLDYPGINHERGNIFIYAPQQKTLMLVDVVYPGYMPYKNLGIAEDIPGYLDVHTKALAYNFSTFVGGHVTRLGDRADPRTRRLLSSNGLNVVGAEILWSSRSVSAAISASSTKNYASSKSPLRSWPASRSVLRREQPSKEHRSALTSIRNVYTFVDRWTLPR
jgi:glyoxylase-like metal-dependent hydrolase (beta-lactamase superfamily II)